MRGSAAQRAWRKRHENTTRHAPNSRLARCRLRMTPGASRCGQAQGRYGHQPASGRARNARARCRRSAGCAAHATRRVRGWGGTRSPRGRAQRLAAAHASSRPTRGSQRLCPRAPRANAGRLERRRRARARRTQASAAAAGCNGQSGGARTHRMRAARAHLGCARPDRARRPARAGSGRARQPGRVHRRAAPPLSWQPLTAGAAPRAAGRAALPRPHLADDARLAGAARAGRRRGTGAGAAEAATT
jgi:hypothetical protein